MTRKVKCVNVVKTSFFNSDLSPSPPPPSVCRKLELFSTYDTHLGMKMFSPSASKPKILFGECQLRTPFRFISVRSTIICAVVVSSYPERRCHFCQITG